MKLKSLKIKNFRTITEEVELSFESTAILFLFGKNNVGKSTVLKALERLFSASPDAKSEDFPMLPPAATTIEIIGVFENLSEDKRLKKWTNNKEIHYKIIASKNDALTSFKFTQRAYNPELQDWEDGAPLGAKGIFTGKLPEILTLPAQGSVDSLETQINDFCKKLVQEKIKVCEEYKKVTTAIQQLQNSYFSSEKLDKINNNTNDKIKDLFPSIKFRIQSQNDSDIRLGALLEKNIQITAEEHGFDIKLRNLGDGLMRLAALSYIVELKQSLGIDTEKQFIVCIEEPELYLHPHMIRRFRNLIYQLTEQGFQVICTSHNPQMLDLSKPHTSIATIKKESPTKPTQIYQVESDLFNGDSKNSIREAFKTQMYFDPNICEVFLADEVMLVESYTEPVVFRYLLAEKFSTRTNKELFIVGTSPTNFVKFIKVFNHFNIKYHVIHDLDAGKEGGIDTRNESIKKEIKPSLGKLYIFDDDFETANGGYKINATDGKPLSALEHFKNLKEEELKRTPAYKYLDSILGNSFYDSTWGEVELKLPEALTV